CFEEEEELMRAYIQEIQDPLNIKIAMEYCDTHDMREMLEMLCNRAESKVNEEKDLEEYMTMYKINMERKDQQSEKYVSKEFFSKIIFRKNETEEMQIFQEILEVYVHYQERDFYKVIAFLPKLKVKLDQSQNSYIQNSLNMRVNHLLQNVYLRSICDFKKVRELAHESLKTSIGKRFEASAYLHLGDSHIHDKDLSQAIYYLEKSIVLYKEIGLDFAVNWMQNKIELVSIRRGRKLDQIHIDQNVAFNYIMNGEKEKGLALLDKIDVTPDKLYIQGMATDNPDYFWKSLNGYLKRGDRLYGLLPVKELNRLGENEKMINMMYNNLKEVKYI
ncbi:AimR family lysis-lysogeny pheromone receptor, partial [Jeotgalibacillus marinus]